MLDSAIITNQKKDNAVTLEFDLTDGTPIPPADEHEFDALLKLLREDKVTRLYVGGQEATADNLEAIANALGGNEQLEVFEMRQSRNNSAAQVKLYHALSRVPNLHTFRAEHCFGEPEAAQAMADLMATHQRLTNVYIQYNGLGIPKTQVMTPVLAHNGGIRELDISFNAMGDTGVDMLAKALKTNKGLVKINVDTSFQIEASIPAVEKMLDQNKNLLEFKGLTSDKITERLATNRAEAEALATAVMDDAGALDATQLGGLQERMASVAYLLETGQGLDKTAVMDKFKEVLVAGRAEGTDIFPAMMAVFPIPDMFDLSAEMGAPLTMKDFHVAGQGATPLLHAIIERGAGASLFRNHMQWQSSEQVESVYKLLPEQQQRQVANRHQLKAQVDAQTRGGAGRRMTDIAL